MLYFRYNDNNFITLKEELHYTKLNENREPIGESTEIREVKIGDIEPFFFRKLLQETGLHVHGTGVLNDLIGVPFDAFSIDDECMDSNFCTIVQYILKSFSQVPFYKGKSLQDLGLKIEFIKRMANKDVNEAFGSYIKDNHLQYIAEEILWKNMTDDEKAGRFNEYIAKIGARDKELVVVDPYLFHDDTDDYCQFLAKIFKMSHCKKVIVVTDKSRRHYKADSFIKVEAKLNTAPFFESNQMLLEFKDEVSANPISIEVKDTDEFHDRFWMAGRRKGFCVGTSFSGIGKRISSINMLPDEDVADIVAELQSSGLL